MTRVNLKKGGTDSEDEDEDGDVDRSYLSYDAFLIENDQCPLGDAAALMRENHER